MSDGVAPVDAAICVSLGNTVVGPAASAIRLVERSTHARRVRIREYSIVVSLPNCSSFDFALTVTYALVRTLSRYCGSLHSSVQDPAIHLLSRSESAAIGSNN